MNDQPIAIAWELRNNIGLLRRVMFINEYVIIGEMSGTWEARFMTYHITHFLTAEIARLEALRCTEQAELQGYEMRQDPRWVELSMTRDELFQFMKVKAGLGDKRGSMAPIYDLVMKVGKPVEAVI